MRATGLGLALCVPVAILSGVPASCMIATVPGPRAPTLSRPIVLGTQGLGRTSACRDHALKFRALGTPNFVLGTTFGSLGMLLLVGPANCSRLVVLSTSPRRWRIYSPSEARRIIGDALAFLLTLDHLLMTRLEPTATFLLSAST